MLDLHLEAMSFQVDGNFRDKILGEMMASMEDSTRQHPSVTDLIYCLTKNYRQSIQPVPVHSEKTKMYFLLGLATEKALIGTRQITQTHGEYEGIHYHIDSMDEDTLVELKTTRGSVKTLNPSTFSESWHRQFMAYLKTQGKTEGKYLVVFIIPAQMEAWHIKYTQEQIDSNWEYLQERKSVWNQAVFSGVEPTPFKYNMEWECKDCIQKIICDVRSRSLSTDG